MAFVSPITRESRWPSSHLFRRFLAGSLQLVDESQLKLELPVIIYELGVLIFELGVLILELGVLILGAWSIHLRAWCSHLGAASVDPAVERLQP